MGLAEGHELWDDLRRLGARRVVDLLADRSTATTADWFKRYPETEIVSRDRAGTYADAARQDAPQARQVADRFHLLKNLRETIERQLGGFEAAIREPAIHVEDDQDALEHPAPELSKHRKELVPTIVEARVIETWPWRPPGGQSGVSRFSDSGY
jgi:transposase